MIGAIVGGIGELFIDLLVQDEEAKRAAKAAVWAGAGAVGVLDAGTSTGVALAAAAAGTMVATQGVAAGVQDASGQAVVDTVGSVAAGGMTSWLALTKAGAGAAAGVVAGGAADGGEGAVKGMRLGASLLQGSGVENVAKLAGGAAGAGVGALAAEGADRAKAIELGIGVGMAVGGGVAAAGATDAMAAENMELAGEAGSSAARVEEMQEGAVVALVSEAAAPLLALAIHDDGERGRDVLDTWSEVRGLVGVAASGVRGNVEAGEELERLGRAALDLGTAGTELGFVFLDREERRREAAGIGRRREGEPTGAEQRADALGLVRKNFDLGEKLFQKRDDRA